MKNFMRKLSIASITSCLLAFSLLANAETSTSEIEFDLAANYSLEDTVGVGISSQSDAVLSTSYSDANTVAKVKVANGQAIKFMIGSLSVPKEFAGDNPSSTGFIATPCYLTISTDGTSIEVLNLQSESGKYHYVCRVVSNSFPKLSLSITYQDK